MHARMTDQRARAIIVIDRWRTLASSLRAALASRISASFARWRSALRRRRSRRPGARPSAMRWLCSATSSTYCTEIVWMSSNALCDETDLMYGRSTRFACSSGEQGMQQQLGAVMKKDKAKRGTAPLSTCQSGLPPAWPVAAAEGGSCNPRNSSRHSASMVKGDQQWWFNRIHQLSAYTYTYTHTYAYTYTHTYTYI